MLHRRLQYILLVLGCLATLLVGFAGCLKSPDDWEGKGGPPRVLVSFPPLYSFVKNVGGDHVGVISICTHTGPHHYEGDAKDHRLLQRADLFFANGLGLDDKFVDPLTAGKAGSPGFLIKLGDRLPKDGLAAVKKDEDGHGIDPHIWLGIPQAHEMVNVIRDELKRVDTAHAADYDKNAAKYQESLTNLQTYGQAAFADKKDKRLISFHESLNYFAASYKLEIVAVLEDGPGDEPTSPKMMKLVEQILKDKIRVIAVEPQYPTESSAKTLLTALKQKGYTDLKLVEVDPLETAEEKDLSADLYERKVRANIDNLAKNLP